MKVLIADDHPAIVEVLPVMIERATGQRPDVSSVVNVDQLFGALAANAETIDLLLLDLSMPGEFQRLGLISQVRQRAPALPILVYSASEEPLLVEAALALGISGFVPKSARWLALQEAVTAIRAGNVYVHPGIDLEAAARHPWKLLTAAEQEVIVSIGRGNTLPVIAVDTDRSYKTVSNLKYTAFVKLGLESKAEVAGYLYQQGLSFLLD